MHFYSVVWSSVSVYAFNRNAWFQSVSFKQRNKQSAQTYFVILFAVSGALANSRLFSKIFKCFASLNFSRRILFAVSGLCLNIIKCICIIFQYFWEKETKNGKSNGTFESVTVNMHATILHTAHCTPNVTKTNVFNKQTHIYWHSDAKRKLFVGWIPDAFEHFQ